MIRWLLKPRGKLLMVSLMTPLNRITSKLSSKATGPLLVGQGRAPQSIKSPKREWKTSQCKASNQTIARFHSRSIVRTKK